MIYTKIDENKKLTAAEKRRIFKVLKFKNQTAYLKSRKTGTKEEKLKRAIRRYNVATSFLNKLNVDKKEKQKIIQYGKRSLKDINTKTEFKKNFKNDAQFNEFLNQVLKSEKKLLCSWRVQKGIRHYSLSKSKIMDMKEYYRKHGSFFVEHEEQTKSDEQLIYAIRSKSLNFRRVENWAVYKQDNGAFFDKHHKTPFDLSEFQIYKTTNHKNYENADACFIHALKVGGLDESKLCLLRSMVKTKIIPKCMIATLCDKVDIQVHVKMMREESKNILKYGCGGDVYELGLINNHYFFIKDCEISKYALEHFDDKEFIKLADWQKKIFKGGRFQIDKNKFIDSFTLIKTMVMNEERFLKPMTLTEEIYKTTLYNQFNNISTLEYSDDVVRENQCKKAKILRGEQKQKPYHCEFFDFETTTDGDKHVPYLARVARDDTVFAGYDERLGFKMLHYLAKKHNYDNLRLYAHNAGYDIKFLFDFIQWDKVIERGNSLLRAYGKFWYRKGHYILVEIQDTKAYLLFKLEKFKDVFKLDMQKEIIPYKMYNTKTMNEPEIWGKGMSIKEVKKYCKKEQLDFNEFMANANKWECVRYRTYYCTMSCEVLDIDRGAFKSWIKKITKLNNEIRTNTNQWDVKDGYIDIIRYSSQYCKMDCEVLANGWETFKKWILEITKLNIDDFISISSLVDNYFRNEGVYDGVYEVSAHVREFEQRCMVGGRCMTRRNKKYRLENTKISDFDACALYPSAMSRLGGYLMGKPKVLSTTDYETLKTYDGYFIEIKINNVNKKRAFPLMSRKTDDGIRDFTNDMEGETVYVDKFMLEDLITYHEIGFDIVRGYYYDEGRNMKLKQTIEHLFNERLKAKKNKNAIQVVYKLMMNAAYGKTLIKPFSTDTKIMTFKNALPFIERQYNFIKSIDILSTKKWNQLTDFDKLKIKIEEPINEHFNNAPCGCEVLSMSKRIMNEVMNTAEDYGFKIFYQDTDSMHCKLDDIKKLSLTYAMKYGRVLIGKGMGQFHSDFESQKLKGEIYACQSIFLGKKCYIDKLVDGETKDEHGNLVYDYHVKMKGMNNRGIVHRANEDYGGDVLAVYKDLYEGKKIEFDLCGGGQVPTFDYNKDGTVSSKNEFIRKIQFL